MSDAIVRASDTRYGHAGKAFLEQLTRDQRDWEAQYTAFKRAPEFTPAQIARARGQTAKPSRQPHRRGHVSSTDSLEALAAADGDGYFLAGREPARDAPRHDHGGRWRRQDAPRARGRERRAPRLPGRRLLRPTRHDP